MTVLVKPIDDGNDLERKLDCLIAAVFLEVDQANLDFLHLFPLPAYAASSVFQPIRSLGVQPRANPNAARLSSEGVEAFAR